MTKKNICEIQGNQANEYKSLISVTFTVKKLTVDHAAEWQSLKFEGVNSFPLGFLITSEEALGNDARSRQVHSKFQVDARYF